MAGKSSWRGLAFGRLTLAAALSLVLACGGGSQGGGATAAVGGKPDFRLKTTDGRTLGPRDFPGQVVVVDFWATWCGPCHLQAKILEPVSRDLAGHGVQFLAADVGEPEDTVRSFLAGSPYPYPVLLDPESKVSDSFGINALPTLMVIDKNGRISFLEPGIHDGDSLKRIIREAGA